MATTFTLKRKYFADPNQQQGEQKKGMSTGKKVALGLGATALAAGTALSAMRGAGNLKKTDISSFKNFGNAVKETFGKGNFKKNMSLSNLGQGAKSLGQAGIKYGKQGFNKATDAVKGVFKNPVKVELLQ